ncbi:MAG TPA: type VI secretion system protein TssA, partial [Myxococcota bacterium]|nr:type VI secretion system protein TssA [Myxococcota bacterium]
EPAKGEFTDWKRVVEIASRILREKSKDVPSASYLAVGLLATEGFAGLVDGLRILESLLQAHWDGGFPPVPARLRARVNAVQYLSDACQKALGLRGEPGSGDREALLACLQACTDLEKVLVERFVDSPVSVGSLTSALREMVERLPREGAPSPAAPANPAPQSSQESAAPGVSGASAELLSRSDVEDAVRRAADFLREKEPTSPLAYRLPRLLRWGEVLSAPPAVDGKTPLIDPPAERVAGLRRLLEASDWAGLLASSEDAFRERPIWMDAQRYSDRALVGLGEPYVAARRGLLDEVRVLLRRLPTLPSLCFQSGTPFADADTKKWILEEVGEESAPSRPATAHAAPDSAEVVAAREEARELARKGRLSHALGRLLEVLGKDGSARGRFLARLELAALASDTGKERVAAPLLEGLDRELQRHGLEDWEPGLALRVLEALYRCRKRLAERRGATPEDTARAEEVFARLCRLDPATGAALE